MTKFIFASIVCIWLLAMNGYAEFGHNYGEISTDEIDMKQCSFDPEANAVIFINEGIADYDDSYHLITLNHCREKILSEKGIENANVSIEFQSKDGYEDVDDIEAMTINIDEQGNRKEYPVDLKSIYTKKISEYFSETRFAFPEVKVGSIIEYKYRSVKKYCSSLDKWDFQSRLPVCFSSFELRPAPTLEFTYLIQKCQKYPVAIKPNNFAHSIYFEMNNLPALGDEPYMDAREDYIQKVTFTVSKFQGIAGTQKYMSNWDDVARGLFTEPDFGKEVRANIKEPQDIIDSAVTGKSDIEKMRFIYDFLRTNIEWNHVNSREADGGVRTTWKKKMGTSGSINLLLVNLMKNAGLEAYPLLVSERGNGKINAKTPFVNQFNNTYAAVIISGKNYYLDATDKYGSCLLIPYDILNTTVLLVKNKSGELIDINETEKKYREIVYFDTDLSPDGRLLSNVQSTSKNYAWQYRNRNYNNKDKEKYIEKILKHSLANVSVDSLEVTGDGNDTTDFVQKFILREQLQSTGNYTFLGLNLFTGFEKNPFILNNRFSNVNFGFMQDIDLVWHIKVPVDWTVDAIPKSVKLADPDHSVIFTREIVYNKDLSQINAKLKIELNKSLYDVDEYAGLQDFFKKMTDMLNEQIVFKTK